VNHKYPLPERLRQVSTVVNWYSLDMSSDPDAMSSVNPPQELETLLAEAWSALEAAVPDGRHGWHLMTVASGGRGSAPDVRTVVMRQASPADRTIAFHTDRRSAKVPVLHSEPEVGLLWYDRERRIQLRATARATIHQDDDLADEAWARSSLSSRRCYLAPHPPSEVLESFSANLPEDLLHRAPGEADSESGRRHFAVVRCLLDSAELLQLRHDGHVRARFTWSGEDLVSEWLAP